MKSHLVCLSDDPRDRIREISGTLRVKKFSPLRAILPIPALVQMKSHQKPHLVAALLLLVASAILLWPSDSFSPVTKPSVAIVRPAHRVLRPAPTLSPRQARALPDLVKLAEKGKYPELSREQIDIYLQAQHRSAGSLLAAYRLSKDEAFFREAMEKFPNDPEVLVTALELPNIPTKRLEILLKLKRVDPDNSIANCLSARILFDLGKNDEALAELSGTFGKTMRDYNLVSQQNVEEAYLSSGYSAVAAKWVTMTQATKPFLIQMRNVADGLKKERATATAAGDEAGVIASQEIQLEIANQVRQGKFLIDTLVATNLEKKVLIETNTPEAHNRIAEIEQQTKTIRDQASKIPILMADNVVPESDWLLYFERIKVFGENAANTWILEKHPEL